MKKLLLMCIVNGLSLVGYAQMNTVDKNENVCYQNEMQNTSGMFSVKNDTCSKLEVADQVEVKKANRNKKNILKKMLSDYAGVDFSGAWGLMSKN